MSRYILSLRDYQFCVICLFICIYFIVCKASKKRNWMWNLYQWSPVKHLLYMLKKTFLWFFDESIIFFLLVLCFKIKLQQHIHPMFWFFFSLMNYWSGEGGVCVLNMYFNDICLLLFFFFFYIIPKQLWMEGGGNNFLHIYIYILENSCEG